MYQYVFVSMFVCCYEIKTCVVQKFKKKRFNYGPKVENRQLCLIRTDVDPKFLSGLGKIRIMQIGIICIGRDWDLPICPV